MDTSGRVADATNAATHPGADEGCDGADANCDGVPDDAPTTTWYTDTDGDGYGADTVEACTPPAGAAPVGGDCAPDDPDAHPDADAASPGVRRPAPA